MSTSAEPQILQPPPISINQQAYSSHAGFGSVGPLIGVLAVILVLGVVAGMIGRLCAGRRIMGHAQYDFEGWIERKCASCIDGRLDPPPRTARSSGAAAAAAAAAEESPQEMKQAEPSPQNHAPAADS